MERQRMAAKALLALGLTALMAGALGGPADACPPTGVPTIEPAAPDGGCSWGNDEDDVYPPDPPPPDGKSEWGKGDKPDIEQYGGGRNTSSNKGDNEPVPPPGGGHWGGHKDDVRPPDSPPPPPGGGSWGVCPDGEGSPPPPPPPPGGGSWGVQDDDDDDDDKDDDIEIETDKGGGSSGGKSAGKETLPAGSPGGVKVVAVTGPAKRLLMPGPKPVWVPLKPGDVVAPPVVIRTGLRAKVVLGFAGGRLVVAPATKMGVAPPDEKDGDPVGRLRVKYGEATYQPPTGPGGAPAAPAVVSSGPDAMGASGGDGPHAGRWQDRLSRLNRGAMRTRPTIGGSGTPDAVGGLDGPSDYGR